MEITFVLGSVLMQNMEEYRKWQGLPEHEYSTVLRCRYPQVKQNIPNTSNYE